MANTRLTDKQIEEMKTMVQKGVYPEDIAKHFKIAVSSVHNYKARFKSQGLKFPSVKGKRPANSLKPEESLNKSQNSSNNLPDSAQLKNENGSHYKFVVNGISIEIGSGAKSINIGKDSMEIHF